MNDIKQKTNLELFHKVIGDHIDPIAFREIEARKLAFLFAMPCSLQEFYEKCKLKNIDLHYRREEIKTEACTHELILREYPSQAYGNCAYCGEFVY